MRRRFRGWAVLLFGSLGLSAACGQMLLGLIDPRAEDYYATPRFVAGQVVTGGDRARVRYDLLTRGPTTFGTPQKPTPIEGPEFDALFAQLADGPLNWQFVYAVNGYRAAEEWGPLGAFARREDKPTAGYLEDEGTAFQSAVQTLASANDPLRPFGYRSSQVLSVARAAVGQEVKLIVRHTGSADGSDRVWYTCWYLTRQTVGVGRWAVYDFDEPVGRVRMTVRRAGDATARLKGTAGLPFDEPPAVGYADAVRDGLAAVETGDGLVVRGMAAKLQQADLIPALVAGRQVLDGHAALLDNDPAAALKQFDAALRTWADTPPAHLGRAAALNRMNKPADALKAIAQYRAEIGNGPEAFREEARAHRAAGDTAKAAEAATAGLTDTPVDPSLLAELYLSLPAGRRGEAGEKAADAGTPGRTLSDLLGRLEAAPGGLPPADAAAVVAGFRAVRPRDPDGLYEDGLVKLRQNKPDAARKLFQDGRERARTRDALVAVLRRAVKHLPPADVYRAVAGADPEAALTAVAEALHPRLPAAATDLAAVTALHRAKAPADPWGDFHAAEAAAARDDLSTADALLAEGMQKLRKPAFPEGRTVPDADADIVVWHRFRGRRAEVLVRLGRWKQAYSELPPAFDTFDQLAGLLAAKGDADGLLALAEMHTRAVPADSETAAVRADGHWRKGQLEPAAAAAADYLTSGVTPKTWNAMADLRVRALVRLNRLDEARAAADEVKRSADELSVTDGPGSDVRVDLFFQLSAVVTAVSDGPDGLLAMLADNTQAGRWAAKFHADPDLGPKLRSPAFEAFRTKYPSPTR